MRWSDRPWGDITKTVEAYGGVAQYCEACLINLNYGPKSDWVAGKCKLPVKEPGGAFNRNALLAAAQALLGARGGVDAPMEEKRRAARRLLALFRQANMSPPDGLKALAGEQ